MGMVAPTSIKKMAEVILICSSWFQPCSWYHSWSCILACFSWSLLHSTKCHLWSCSSPRWANPGQIFVRHVTIQFSSESYYILWLLSSLSILVVIYYFFRHVPVSNVSAICLALCYPTSCLHIFSGSQLFEAISFACYSLPTLFVFLCKVIHT